MDSGVAPAVQDPITQAMHDPMTRVPDDPMMQARNVVQPTTQTASAMQQQASAQSQQQPQQQRQVASDNSEAQATRVMMVGDEPPDRMLPPIQGLHLIPVPSLRDAVEETAVPRAMEIATTALDILEFDRDRSAAAAAASLTPDEAGAVYVYTMEWQPDSENSLYRRLNAALRDADRSQCKRFFPFLRLLSVALDKLPVVSAITVYRGVKRDLSAVYNKPPGTKFVWWQLSSCTERLQALESELFVGKTGPRTLFTIEVCDGRRVQALSAFREEAEVLLPAGAKFELMGVLDMGVAQGTGPLMVTLRQLPGRFVS